MNVGEGVIAAVETLGGTIVALESELSRLQQENAMLRQVLAQRDSTNAQPSSPLPLDTHLGD